MANLTTAHQELFRRSPDECFSSLEEIVDHCRRQRDASADHWHTSSEVRIDSDAGTLVTAFLNNRP